MRYCSLILAVILGCAAWPLSAGEALPPTVDQGPEAGSLGSRATLRIVAPAGADSSYRAWTPYLGPLELRESEFFAYLDRLEDAETARVYAADRHWGRMVDVGFLILGGGLYVYGASADETDYTGPARAGGPMLAAVGLLDMLFTSGPPRAATLGRARAALAGE